MLSAQSAPRREDGDFSSIGIILENLRSRLNIFMEIGLFAASGDCLGLGLWE